MLEGCLCPLLTVVSNLTDKRGHFPAILSWVVGRPLHLHCETRVSYSCLRFPALETKRLRGSR